MCFCEIMAPQEEDVLIESASGSESEEQEASDGEEGEHIRHLKARRQELQHRVYQQVGEGAPQTRVLSQESQQRTGNGNIWHYQIAMNKS